VHDDVAVVEQDPRSTFATLLGARARTVLLAELLLDGVDDRADLAGVPGARDDEVVGDRDDVTDVEDDDVVALLVAGGCRGDQCALRCVRGVSSGSFDTEIRPDDDREVDDVDRHVAEGDATNTQRSRKTPGSR
jgi:hypothetical protein